VLRQAPAIADAREDSLETVAQRVEHRREILVRRAQESTQLGVK
jgi:hypothetical protein